jgi:hypothetical protein
MGQGDVILPAETREGIEALRAADPSFGSVADTLLALAGDDSVSPQVYERVCDAVFTVLMAWARK